MTESSADDKLEYLTKDLLQPLVDRSWRPSPQHSGEQNDDDSNHLFMSEPSMSEADSSELLHNLLSPAASFTEDENMDDLSVREEGADCYLVMPPPPPPPRLLNTAQYPQSPGNTSLSSWESPHLSTRQVQVHFSPDRKEPTKRRHKRSVGSGERHLFMPSQETGTDGPALQNMEYGTLAAGGLGYPQGHDRVANGSDHQRSSDSSIVSEGQRQRLEDFLDELRVTSKGQVQETATGAHTSFESDFVPPAEKAESNMKEVLRISSSDGRTGSGPSHQRVSSGDTAMVQNTSVHSIPTSSARGMSNPDMPADDTVVMTLSASEDEGTKETSTTGEGSRPLDWEHQHSADDEKTTQGDRPRRIRNKQTNGGHRRQRSGDAAAASLLTGSTDWKGMEQDKIPLPPLPGGQDDDEDDDDDNDENHRLLESGKEKIDTIHGSPPFRVPPGSLQVEQFSKFAIGSPGSHSSQVYVNRQTRRSRREYRARQKRSDSNEHVATSWPKEAGNALPSTDRLSPPTSYSSDKPPLSPTRGASLPFIPRDSELRRALAGSSVAGSYSGGSYDWSTSERPTHHITQSAQYGQYGMAQAWSHSERPVSLPRTQMTPNSHINASPQHSWYSGKQPDQYPNPHDHWGQSVGSVSSAESSFSWLSGGPFQSSRLKYRESPTAELSPTFWLPPQQRKESFLRDVHDDAQRDDRVSSDGSESSSFEEGHLSMQNIGDPRRPTHPSALRHHHSPFANFGKSTGKADRRRFLPQTTVILDDAGGNKFPTYICPNCKTVQREFFTVSDAPRQFESASFYVGLYFGIYVVAALYIFGLQEGWPALDCIYFAVITLTTAGLGDLVPTSDGSKILCSVFIYFGVACIGLLLGSYIAGMLDESSRREQKANRIDSCPNCARIKTLDERKDKLKINHLGREEIPKMDANIFPHSFSERSTDIDILTDERSPKKLKHVHGTSARDNFTQSERIPTFTAGQSSTTMGSPVTAQILGRQSHTRHASFDLNSQPLSFMVAPNASQGRKFSADLPTTVEEGTDANQIDPPPPPPSEWQSESGSNGLETDDETSDSDESASSSSLDDITSSGDKLSQVKRNGKYVFLTLKEALVNSMVIIAFGCLGFYFIEGFSIIDSWYFTTVLLTTVGYGDIVPVTRGGKLFATVYILVAGTILLNNMSMISMIPLELRKRRIEKAVLSQFGDQLDDASLRELATGPLIQRLNLSAQRPGGLDECTREMFALAMLVRLGKVTEQDLKSTFAAFRRLDVNNDGVLNSRSIIAGMIQKRRNTTNFSQHPNQTIPVPPPQYMQPQPTPTPYWPPANNFYYYGSGSKPPASYHYSPVGPQMSNGDIATPANEQSSLMNGNKSYGAYNMPMSANDSSTRSF